MKNNSLLLGKRIVFFISLFFVVLLNVLFVFSGAGDANDTNETFCAATTSDPLAWKSSGQAHYNDFWVDTVHSDGTYYPNCCGDDTSEYREYQYCAASGDATDKANYCSSGLDTTSCCSTANNCVYAYACYSPGAYKLDSATINNAYCNAGLWEDCDASASNCDACIGSGYYNNSGESVTHGEYTDGAGTECCGDDSDEYLRSSSFHASIDTPTGTSTVCCNANTDCVASSVCVTTGSTGYAGGQGTFDYCSSGTWYDCNADAHCLSGYTCVSNNCIDEASPQIADATYDNSREPNVFAYLTDNIGDTNTLYASLIDQDTQTVQQSASQVLTANQEADLVGTCTVVFAKAAGDRIILLDCGDIADQVLNGFGALFQNHRLGNLSFYHINGAPVQNGDQVTITIDPGLAQAITAESTVGIYDQSAPTGYAGLSLTAMFAALPAGNYYYQVWAEDSASNQLGGTVLLGPFYCTGTTCNNQEDNSAPDLPIIWSLPSEVSTGTVDVVGYINESINVTVKARNATSVLSYFETSAISGVVSNIYTSCTVSGTASVNSTNVDLTCVNPNAVSVGRYLQFAGHDGTFFERYQISSVESYSGSNLGVVLSRQLENSLADAESVEVHDNQYPSGWFNVTVTLQQGNSTIRVWGTDSNNNVGDYTEVGPVFYDGSDLDPQYGGESDRPVLWPLSSVTGNSSIRVIGFSNASYVTTNVYTVGDPSYVSSVYINETVQPFNSSRAYAAAGSGSTKLYIPQADYDSGKFGPGKYIEFSGHFKEYYIRYTITGTENVADPNYEAVNITPALEEDVVLNESIRIFSTDKPLGWFNVSIVLQFNGTNQVSAYNNQSGTSESASPQSIYLDMIPPDMTNILASSYENPFTYTFDIADDYAVGTVNMTMIGPGGSITPSSILCTGVDTSKTCQVYLSRTEGTHNVSFTVLDSVGNTHYENSTFILDTTVSSLAEINDSGDITSSKTLTATWSPYIDNVSSLDHYEYAIGVVPYPLTGYDSVLAWTNTGSNTVNSGPHNLIHGTVYYISARAQNNVGLYTNVVTTDGIVYADNTPPLIPGIWDEGVFTSTDEGIFVWWNATDDESGVAAYELAVGTAAYPYEGWYNMAAYAFPSTTNSQFFTLALEQNETYYVTVRAQNGYGAWSQRNSSDGITVDITAPAEGNINYSAGTYETNSVSLFFDEGRDNESGIMESSLWYARLLYRDNTCSGNYVFDNYIGDVTGTYDYNYTMENGYCYKFMLRVYNNANLSSEYYYYRDLLNKSIFVDTTPPVTFNVTDDGAITYDGTKLHAEWTSSSDAESGLDHYEYRVQYTFNNGPRIGLVNWTDVGLATEITDYFRLNHTNLTHQYKYYYDVRAFNSISMNTTESSDGIIYIDIYKPETTLVSVGRDFDAPYSDENFGNISINVSGEIDMKCVYSVNDIDYSDSADECTTYGTMASCLIENLQTGNYTYHIICSDINGNGQDFDENIDVSFSAFVYEPIVHSVIVNSTDVLRITYKNASDYLFGTGYSDSVINTTLFENYVYKMIIENPGGKFIVRMDDVNVSENQVFNISAKEINISQIASNVTGIGADERYIPRYAYAMEIGSNYSGNYFIRFNYTNISVSNENALMIYRLAYDFNNDSIDYNVSTLYSGASRDTSSNFVSVTVENFSVYVLVEDRDMPETCGDLIDNDGNGLVDDGCPTPKTSPGGSSDKEVVARRSGGGGYSVPRFEDCDDDRMNQDETGVDCGGICAEEPYSRKCVAGQGCLENNDCETEACNLEIGLCYQPTCTDRLLNQGEEDVDCGGPCDECYDNTEDFDKDGIPNVWEEKYSVMDPRDASDARKDPDNDGLENIFEYKYGTDPSKPDTDGDGFSDNEEILIKTDPLDRNSVPPNCDDKIKNNGEEDVDCGGPCNTCVVVEEPAPSVLVPLMFGFIIIGAIVAGLIFRQRQKVIVREKTKAEPVAETLSDTTLLGKQSIPAKPIPVIPIRKKIDVSDAMLLKLQNYVNYKVMQEESLETVRKELESLKWPEYIIDQVLRNTGDIRYMKKLYELDDYINTDLKGFSHAEIRKRLKLSKWDDADIDLVISKAFNLSDFQALDNFVMLQLAKGTDKNDIETLLEQAGWPRKILDRIMLQHISLLKKDQEEIEEKILFFFQKGYTEKQVTSRMLNMGFNEDIVNLIIFSKYSVEKNVDILRNYVNMRLIKGDTIESIRKTIINAHWGIDVIDMIIHENFRATDMKYLIALDKYIKDAFVKGYTKDIITNDLLVQKWADEYIDLVMLEVHIIDDKVDNVKKFINLRLEKGDARNKITELLVKIGWGRKVVEDVFENRK